MCNKQNGKQEDNENEMYIEVLRDVHVHRYMYMYVFVQEYMYINYGYRVAFIVLCFASFVAYVCTACRTTVT